MDIQEIINNYSNVQLQVKEMTKDEKIKIMDHLLDTLKQNIQLNPDQVWELNMFIRDLDLELREVLFLKIKIEERNVRNDQNTSTFSGITRMREHHAYLDSMNGSRVKLTRFDFSNEELTLLNYDHEKTCNPNVNEWTIRFKGTQPQHYYEYYICFSEKEIKLRLLSCQGLKSEQEKLKSDLKKVLISKIHKKTDIRMRFITGKYPIIFT